MQGKVAIVTGAAGGIGEAIVRKLGSRGVKVLGTGRNADKLAALKARLDGVCSKVPAADGQKAACEAVLKGSKPTA